MQMLSLPWALALIADSAQAWATQAASQASGESGGNTNLPSWAHLTQLAQVCCALWQALPLTRCCTSVLTGNLFHVLAALCISGCFKGCNCQKGESAWRMRSEPSQAAAQALQQQGARAQGSGPSPLGFMRPPANNS